MQFFFLNIILKIGKNINYKLKKETFSISFELLPSERMCTLKM